MIGPPQAMKSAFNPRDNGDLRLQRMLAALLVARRISRLGGRRVLRQERLCLLCEIHRCTAESGTLMGTLAVHNTKLSNRRCPSTAGSALG